MLSRTHFAGLWLIFAVCGQSSAAAAEFRDFVLPLVKEHCLRCHSAAENQGELDLEQFDSLERVKRRPAVWQRVLEQLASGEMPPKERPPLAADQRRRLIRWVEATLDEVALAQAGDPGPVVLRRLSNAEYTWSIRDLTGVAALDPAREFPADGAAGEGFTNAGAALVMSPSLLSKYLDAAKDVAAHAVLLPDGIRFSPSTTPRDWTDEALARIRAFYARYSDTAGATAVNLQGIKFDTNAGGRLPVGRYLAALVAERDELRSGKTTLAALARETQLNEKYLTTLWRALQDEKSSLLVNLVRQRFNACVPGDVPELAREIAAWQQSLWRFASVGHIGKVNGPKGWQEPMSPLVAQQELRLKLVPPVGGGDLTVYLSVGDAGDGNEGDEALWQNPRLVAKGRPDVALRQVPSIAGQLARQTQPVDELDFAVHAPAVIELRLPASLAEGAELVVTGKLQPAREAEGSVQLRLTAERPQVTSGIVASQSQTALAAGRWSDNNLRTIHGTPIIVNDDSQARRRFEQSFHDFRRLFPAALCYPKIVPVDEVVTLTLFYREDEQLQRLMLADVERAELDRLWNELEMVSEAPLKQVDVFEQLYQFATQDANPSAFEPLREPILQRAAAFRTKLIEAEPRQLQSALDFAAQAWRRPLTLDETSKLRGLYRQLRDQPLSHGAALRMVLARVLVAPAFLYRGEQAPAGDKAAPVSDWELATRLSYFLTSSLPDDELRSLAAAGRLQETETLRAQTRRLLKGEKTRRLATEFGCQWLQIRDLDTLDEKSERHFPTFQAVRGAMQEEAVRFFMDLFQNDRSVLSLLDADYTFVNSELARHYGVEVAGDEWRRIAGLRDLGRGGVIGMASTLAKQSGASRTSPILRGNWISEVLLGEKLPRPPEGVPVLPAEAPPGLTERQLIERHGSDARCAGCHQRIDPLGFALEGFDAIGRSRTADAGGLAIETHARLLDGTEVTGLDGLRSYLVQHRRDDFLRQFCRKLVGYALGRAVQLSDKPLVDALVRELAANDYRVSVAVERIVMSPQFRQVRGRDFVSEP